jgi:uncharacterized protein
MKKRLMTFAVTVFTGCAVVAVLVGGLGAAPAAHADSTYVSLPYTQNWLPTNMITADDDWSGVPGIIGYTGDEGDTYPVNTDPQTVLRDLSHTAVQVKANQSSPNALTSVAIAEFETQDGVTGNPMVAIRPQSDFQFPHLLIHINTSGYQNIRVQYDLVDIDATGNNSVQQVALHFRVGTNGDFTNVPDAYVADATEGPEVKGLVTPVDVQLPASANNQGQVQLRIMSSNAAGADEWVGIDNISISGTPINGVPPTPTTPPGEPTPTTPPDGDHRLYLPLVTRGD